MAQAQVLDLAYPQELAQSHLVQQVRGCRRCGPVLHQQKQPPHRRLQQRPPQQPRRQSRTNRMLLGSVCHCAQAPRVLQRRASHRQLRERTDRDPV